MKRLLIGCVALFAIALAAAPGRAAAQTATTTPQSSTSCTVITQRLAWGASDAWAKGQVATLQRFLVSKGYVVDISGYFGSQTDRALRDYQQKNGLPNVGYTEERTRAFIRQASCPTIVTTQDLFEKKLRLAVWWKRTTVSPLDRNFDLNNDGIVNVTDLSVIDMVGKGTASTTLWTTVRTKLLAATQARYSGLSPAWSSPNYMPDLDIDNNGYINTSDYLRVRAAFDAVKPAVSTTSVAVSLAGSSLTVVPSNSGPQGLNAAFFVRVKPIGGSLPLPTVANSLIQIIGATTSTGVLASVQANSLSVTGNPTVLAQDTEYMVTYTAFIASSSLPVGTNYLKAKLASVQFAPLAPQATDFLSDSVLWQGAPAPVKSITVQTPNGGETWSWDGQSKITWTSQGIDPRSRADIYLQFPDYSLCNIGSGPLSTGIFYSIPQSQGCAANPAQRITPGQYKAGVIVMGADGNPLAKDYSDSFFTISSSTQVQTVSAVSVASNPPAATHWVDSVQGAQMVPMLEFGLKSVGGASDINQISIQVSQSVVLPKPTPFYLYQGDTMLGSVMYDPSVGKDGTTFNYLHISIPSDTTKVFMVKADIPASVVNGTVVTNSLTAVGYTPSSGEPRYAPMTVPGNPQTFSKQTVATVSPSSTNISIQLNPSTGFSSAAFAQFTLKVKPTGGSLPLPTYDSAAMSLVNGSGSALASGPASSVTVAGNPAVLSEGTEYSVTYAAVYPASMLPSGTYAVKGSLGTVRFGSGTPIAVNLDTAYAAWIGAVTASTTSGTSTLPAARTPYSVPTRGTVLGATLRCYALTWTLMRGMTDASTGGQVTQLQEFLETQGYSFPDKGTFGAKTELAVREWQLRHGIDDTGIVGSVTRANIATVCR